MISIYDIKVLSSCVSFRREAYIYEIYFETAMSLMFGDEDRFLLQLT